MSRLSALLPTRWGRRPVRLLALLAFHDERRYLPGWFANVPPEVDGVVALDDGSTDGSAELVAAQLSVLALLRRERREPHVWHDGENHRLLAEAARRLGADWLLGVDADERLECGFGARARALVTDRGAARAYYVHVRELWDAPDRMRVDGVWGGKRSARLFAARRRARYDDRALHGHWAPLDARDGDDFRQADLYLYHLRMIRPEDRQARRDKYRRLDPERRFQSIGYDYLTDTAGLALAPLPPGRGYQPLEAP
jgi:hypothetical protein